MSRRDLILLAVIALAAAAPARQPGPASQQAPTFRTATTLVEVDVIVKDRAGRFVPGLGAGDFELLENGVPQRIETFYAVEGPRHAPGGRAAPAAGEPVSPPSAGAAAASAAPASPRAFVLYFDLEHLGAGSLGRAKDAARAFLLSDLQAGDIGGVVAGGTLAGNRLTSDTEELRAAIGSIRSPGTTRSRELDMREWPRFVSLWEVSRVNARDDRAIGIVVNRACDEDPDSCRALGGADAARYLVESKGQALAGEARLSATRTLATMESLVAGLAKFPGRKTIVFLSEGFLSEELPGQLQAVVGRAAGSNVRIYALDARGLNRGSADSRILDAPGSTTSPGNFDFDVAADGPNSLAVDTGGLLVRNENDFGKALREIADDTSSCYVLGYRPSAPAADGKFRLVSVRVRREGVAVRARKGYIPQAAAGAPAPPPPAAAPLDRAPSLAGAGVLAPTPTPVPSTPSEPAPPVADASPAGIMLRSGASPDGVPAPADPASVRLRPAEATGASGATLLREEGGRPDLPADLAAAAQRGWDAYQRGDTKGARDTLARPAAHEAAAPWIHYVLGWASFAEGDTPKARVEWERVRAQVPDFRAVYLDLADTYLREGRRPDALVVLGEAERRWPGDADVLNAVGVVRAAIGRFADAIAAFERAVAANTSDAVSHFNLARVSELKFVAAAAGGAPGAPPPSQADRERAAREYRKVLELGGPQPDEVRASLFRLQPLDATRLSLSDPRPVVRLKYGDTGGTPVRLAWSPDGSTLCVRATERDRRGRLLRDSLRLLTLDGRVQEISEAPAWAGPYWEWKSALAAPWLPDVRVTAEQRADGRGTDQLTSTRPDWNRTTRLTTERVFRFQGEVIGVAGEADFVAGTTFGWAPFALGAIAATDTRGVLSVIDSAGRRKEVPDSRVALLPAWSPDGRRIAFLRQDRGLALVMVEVSTGGTPVPPKMK